MVWLGHVVPSNRSVKWLHKNNLKWRMVHNSATWTVLNIVLGLYTADKNLQSTSTLNYTCKYDVCCFCVCVFKYYCNVISAFLLINLCTSLCVCLLLTYVNKLSVSHPRKCPDLERGEEYFLLWQAHIQQALLLAGHMDFCGKSPWNTKYSWRIYNIVYKHAGQSGKLSGTWSMQGLIQGGVDRVASHPPLDSPWITLPYSLCLYHVCLYCLLRLHSHKKEIFVFEHRSNSILAREYI